MELKIVDVKAICTAPEGIPLVVVKLSTSQEGLYGLGCATFTQRHKAVAYVVETYMKPFLLGKNPQDIEDIWQTGHVNSYWRNGPVLNNALAGVDMALWDIKGKLAGMPLYQLWGGKCRPAAAVYTHAEGSTPEELLECAGNLRKKGFRKLRLQLGGYGARGQKVHSPSGCPQGEYYDPKRYMDATVECFRLARQELGREVELCHDVHERLSPADAVKFAKRMEEFDLLFLEDALAPEQIAYFHRIRSQCATPIAVGELFCTPNDWMPLVHDRLIDYIRIHISMIGGITPARKAAALCEAYGIKTAWHGPGDLSPVGHAVNLHLDLSCHNFGIQEWWRDIGEASRAVFPGAPSVHDGYAWLHEAPGIGVDLDEAEAAKYPCGTPQVCWTMARLPDGTAAYP